MYIPNTNVNVFVVMWQDAKEIITRRMRAIAGTMSLS